MTATPSLCAPIDRHDTDACESLTAEEQSAHLLAAYWSLKPTERAHLYRDATDDEQDLIDADIAGIRAAVRATVDSIVEQSRTRKAVAAYRRPLNWARGRAT